jgi:tRNA (mo5U34)-methyltransferase
MSGLAEAVAGYEWFHSIDLGGGVITPGMKSLEIHRKEAAAFFDPVKIDRASVLDIGAWNGVYSFEAKRRGAARVVASDSYCWGPKHRGRESFELARSTLGLEVEALTADTMELSPERHGSFDVVLFAGVLYHLKNPVGGLEAAAAMARDVLIVETHGDLNQIDRPAAAFYPGKELNEDDTNWWGPNIPWVISMLQHCGFVHVDVSQVVPGRFIFHAWRSDARRVPGWDFPAPHVVTEQRNGRAQKLKLARRLFLEALGLRRPRS